MRIDKVEMIGTLRVGRLKAKKGFEYPQFRLPMEFSDLIGKEMVAYKVEIDGSQGILLMDKVLQPIDRVLQQTNEVVKPSKYDEEIKELKKAILEIRDLISGKGVQFTPQITKICRGGDSNPRPPDYESGAPTS